MEQNLCTNTHYFIIANITVVAMHIIMTTIHTSYLSPNINMCTNTYVLMIANILIYNLTNPCIFAYKI